MALNNPQRTDYNDEKIQNPLRKPINRAEQMPREGITYKRGITIYDIDTTIYEYMRDIVVPKLELDKKQITVPVIYGNAERWKAAQIDGVYRDERGKIILPMVMFKRTSITPNESMAMLNRQLNYQSYIGYSNKNRYDKFSLLNNFKPRKEIYDITMPDYVQVTYEIMIWTNYTEHMNKIVEQFQWASNEYWGSRDGFKFRSVVDSFDKITEMTENQERLVRTTFSVTTYAYLLPESFDNESTIKKSISTRAVVTTIETDINKSVGDALTSGITMSDYNDNKILFDYINLYNSKIGVITGTYQITFSNTKLVTPPTELSVTATDGVKVYINGVKYSKAYWTGVQNGNNYVVTFDAGLLGFGLNPISDEVSIVGKIIV
jgi:hypothetical protein